MSTNLQINLDQTARDMRRELDNAKARVVAGWEVEIDHRDDIEMCIVVWAWCDLVLRNIDPREVDNVTRFRSLRDEAKRIENDFWHKFSLHKPNIEITIQHNEVVKKHAGGPPKGQPKHIIGDSARKAIMDDLAPYIGKSLSAEDARTLSQYHGVSISTLYRFLRGVEGKGK